MIHNEIQNWLDKEFPELKLYVLKDNGDGVKMGFRSEVSINFWVGRDSNLQDDIKFEALYRLESMLYKKLGLLSIALEDVRKLRRNLDA